MKTTNILLPVIDDNLANYINNCGIVLYKQCGYYAVEKHFYYLVRDIIEDYNDAYQRKLHV